MVLFEELAPASLLMQSHHPIFGSPCHIRLPEVRPLRALYRYNEMTRRLVVPFKHSDRLDMLPMLQRMMAQRFSELTANSPLVVPVPLHRWLFFLRCYNQAEELARRL